MKRCVCIFLTSVLALSLAACAEEKTPGTTEENTLETVTEAGREPSAAVTEPASEAGTEPAVPETVAPETEEETEAQESARETTGEASENTEETEPGTIDYSTVSIRDCVYAPEGREGAEALLSRINGICYGTAGSSIQIVDGAVAMAELTAEPDAVSAVEAFLSEMTPIQKDYFSYSWQRICGETRDLIGNFDRDKFLSYAPGYEDFDISRYSESDLQVLSEEVRALFSQQGIREEWRNYTERFPFFAIG